MTKKSLVRINAFSLNCMQREKAILRQSKRPDSIAAVMIIDLYLMHVVNTTHPEMGNHY